jgi:hypothetical protein
MSDQETLVQIRNEIGAVLSDDRNETNGETILRLVVCLERIDRMAHKALRHRSLQKVEIDRLRDEVALLKPRVDEHGTLVREDR